ncbi:hypothetical protein JB92DRAFT_3016552 [Gautieria morchelliformis]|nr:hypothetical protein JB92DRAFT_3016552 [Gautieria morchelliformis]
MGTPVSLQPTLSVEEIRSYSTTTSHPFDCDWNGCNARLNCWINLQKHYHRHCKDNQNKSATRSCGLRFCTLETNRPLSLSSLMDHINKSHLSRVHIPCPAAGCRVFEHLDRMYLHFQNDHDSDPGMMLAPQAFPFRPSQDAKPLPPLPHGLVPTYTVSPCLVLPGRKKKITTKSDSEPYTDQAKRHLTFWSLFEYGESLDGHEERSMKEHDLDFEPLHHPTSLSGKEPWPGFAVSAEPVVVPLINQVSSPPVATRISLPSKPDVPAPQTFLYQAFKRYLETKSH